MIIDEILDLKEKLMEKVDLQYIYDEAKIFNFDYIVNAIDNLDNKGIQNAICKYIIDNGYNTEICDFVKTIKFINRKATKKTYYFVADDYYGQHGCDIEKVEMTKYAYNYCSDNRLCNGKRGFITDSFMGAMYYVND